MVFIPDFVPDFIAKPASRGQFPLCRRLRIVIGKQIRLTALDLGDPGAQGTVCPFIRIRDHVRDKWSAIGDIEPCPKIPSPPMVIIVKTHLITGGTIRYDIHQALWNADLPNRVGFVPNHLDAPIQKAGGSSIGQRERYKPLVILFPGISAIEVLGQIGHFQNIVSGHRQCGRRVRIQHDQAIQACTV